MDDEGNTRRSDFEEDTLNAMRPEMPNYASDATKGNDTDETPNESGFYHQDKNDNLKDNKKEAKRYAASDLGDAERSATGSGERSNNDAAGGVDEARDKESNPSGGYYNNSQKNADSAKGSGRGIKAKLSPLKGKKSGFKKYGALTTMFIFLMFGAFISTSTMSTQLNAWKENIYSMFGQNSAVITKRSNFLMRTFLSTNKDITRPTFLGKTRFSIGKKLASNMEKEHIYYVDEEVNGKKLKMLVYVDEDGKATPIVADGRDMDGAKSLAGNEFEFGGKKVTLSESPMVLSQAKLEYDAFSNALNKSTLTVTGKMAGWFSQFGDVPESLLERLIGSKARNQMGDLTDESTKEQVEEEVAKPSKMQDGDIDTEERKSGEEEEEGEDGGESDKDAAEKDRINNEDSKLSGGDVSAVTAKLQAKAEKAAAYAGGANLLCGFLQAMGTISSTVGAIQTANSVAFASKYLEIADKIKAQDANNSINLANELLNEPRENEIYDNGVRVDEGKKTATTASVGYNAAFSQNDIIDEDSPVTKSVNRENTMTVAMENLKGTPGEFFAPLLEGLGSIGSGLEVTKACNGAKKIAASLGLVADVIAVFAPGGGFIKSLIKNVMEIGAVQIIMAAAGFIIGLIAPIVAQWVGSSLAKVVFGEVGGMVLWSGAQSLMNSNLQMSTGLLPDKQGAMDVFGLTREVEQEEWARQDRIALSPFDTSSKYTFLGSIVNSFVPIVNQSGNGVVSTMSSVAKLAGDSALALTSPSASAAEETYKYELSLASENNCYRLHSVGAEGTETCHKYNGASVQDLDTLDPDDILVKIDEIGRERNPYNPNFDGAYSDGNPKINPDSDLGKYIVACIANDSQPGDVDASVEGFIQKAQNTISTGNALADSLIDFGIGLVPFSDLPDLGAAIEESNNLVWNSKQACTGRTGDTELDEEVRYFSTYTLDQRVMEELGVIDNNSVMAFLDDYYEENPLDQSYEGIIARYSGQTKDEVEVNLAYLDYIVALYEYDPSERYAFGESDVKIDKPLRLDHQTEIQVADAREKIANEFAQIIYADVRNRTAVV